MNKVIYFNESQNVFKIPAIKLLMEITFILYIKKSLLYIDI